MKLKKLIPFSVVNTVVASFAPVYLSSCSIFSQLNVLNGYTPTNPPCEAREFDSIDDLCQYYVTLNKKTLSEDYVWSLGEYVKENFEFPSPVFPFKFTKIEIANVTLEDWWTQPYDDPAMKNVFYSSYTMTLQLSGSTEPRKNSNVGYGSYIDYAYTVVSLNTTVNKAPYTIIQAKDENVSDAKWIVQPATDDILGSNSVWSISTTCEVVYKKQESHSESITTTDMLGSYWFKDNLYDPSLEQTKSYLYKFAHDALVYGSYHLQNCSVKK